MYINTLSLRQLVALYNEHVPQARRVKTFQTKSIALKRVAAVLPKAALGTKATAKERAPRLSVDSKKAVSMLRGECTVAALAKALGVSERSARSCIDRLRRSGHKIKNTGPSTFRAD